MERDYTVPYEYCEYEKIEQLRQLAESQTVVLLDDETNNTIDDTSKPLSHASLIVRYAADEWPE